MNDRQRQALREARANAADNLTRAQIQQRANPGWVSGNGESIDTVIAGYQRIYDELSEGL